ncbi:MAG: SdiA-regulated domain-containing protein [Gammaproteobacteria bacterium]|nr:SdiA-regulated domain-containing protein [Gammaproteobacteria bacterium]
MRVLTFLPLLLAGLIAGCGGSSDSADTPPPGQSLALLAVYDIAVSDPSGLALDYDGVHLWTVSDDPGMGMYQLTRQGEVVRHVPFASDDLEGIVVDPANLTLWVVEERLRQILNVTRDGVILSRTAVDVPANRPNDGLEGITINTRTGDFFVVNEKNPRLLLRLDRDLEILETVPIDFTGPFAMGDLSGISYDPVENMLWIISDESRRIVVIDMQYNPVRVYQTGIVKGEGIAVDPDNRRVYAVCDEESRLYVYAY